MAGSDRYPHHEPAGRPPSRTHVTPAQTPLRAAPAPCWRWRHQRGSGAAPPRRRLSCRLPRRGHLGSLGHLLAQISVPNISSDQGENRKLLFRGRSKLRREFASSCLAPIDNGKCGESALSGSPTSRPPLAIWYERQPATRRACRLLCPGGLRALHRPPRIILDASGHAASAGLPGREASCLKLQPEGTGDLMVDKELPEKRCSHRRPARRPHFQTTSRLVALSLGERRRFISDQHAWLAPAIDVPVATTTGARDSFVAGLTWAFSQHFRRRRCLRFWRRLHKPC